jgi:hypothetical protein
MLYNLSTINKYNWLKIITHPQVMHIQQCLKCFGAEVDLFIDYVDNGICSSISPQRIMYCVETQSCALRRSDTLQP